MCAKLSRANSSNNNNNGHIQWRSPSPNRNLMNHGRFVHHYLSYQQLQMEDNWLLDSSPLSPMSVGSSSSDSLSASPSPNNTNNNNSRSSKSSHLNTFSLLSPSSTSQLSDTLDSPPQLTRYRVLTTTKSCNDIVVGEQDLHTSHYNKRLIIPYHLRYDESQISSSSGCATSTSDIYVHGTTDEHDHRDNKKDQQQHYSTSVSSPNSLFSTTTPPMLSITPISPIPPPSFSNNSSSTDENDVHNNVHHNSSNHIITSSATSPLIVNNSNQLKMPQGLVATTNNSPQQPQHHVRVVSPLTTTTTTSSDQHQQQHGGYLGHSGKAYILVEKKSVNTNEGMQMVKCSLRLKEGKSLLIKKQSEHTLTFKITPFTCAKYTPLSSGSTTMASRVLVTVSELSSSSLGSDTPSSSQPTATKQAKQSYFVPELQFIFGSLEEAKEFCDKIVNNVYCYCTDLVSSKVQKELQQHSKAPSPISDTKPEGYIIRKNQKAHIKTYQKPSIIYAELLNKQLLFYTSHKKTKVADVIGCRVDFTREKYYTDYLSTGTTQKNENHRMAFTLNVGNEGESRETLAFPTSGDTQKWLSIFSTSTSPDVVAGRADDFESESEVEQDEEEKGSEDEGDGDEMDDELAQLLGLGGDTVVVHTDVAVKEDVVGDAILEIGEPDIFGKRKNNVFNDGFWQPPKNSTPSSKSPPSVSTPPVSPVHDSPLSELQSLKNRVAELEKLLADKTRECADLRRELNNKK